MNEELFEYLYATEQVDEFFGLKEEQNNNKNESQETPYIKTKENNNKNRG